MANKEAYINKLLSWYGYNEADGTDDIIIDIYNSQRPAGSYKMTHSDPWCHATISAAAYETGCTSVIPNTAYCPDGINWFKARGQWVGRTYSNYNPTRGDIIYYDWGSDGESDHVGCITSRSGSTLTVIEGNKSDMCTYRYINMWDYTIMGYGRPAWDGSSSTTNPEDRGWLQYGDTGSAVKEMQKMLNAIGYTVNVDGKQMIYIWPVSNPRKLNRLRKEINTCSIEEYVLLLKESSGMEVIYEPKLTVKEMKKRGLLDHFDNTSEE